MKKIILSLIILSVLFITQSSTAVLAKSSTVKKYDSRNNYSGKYVTVGQKTKEYTKNGNYNGYYKQDGDKIKKYSKNGNYEGSYKVED